MSDERWLGRAIELAVENVEQGGRPFGAVVVRDGELVATGVNRALQDGDPTAHAELLALREAGRALGTIVLRGCIVYASGEPCPMCQAAATLAGVDGIVFAAAGELAAGVGLGTGSVGDELARPFAERRIVPVRHVPVDGAERPFAAFAARV